MVDFSNPIRPRGVAAVPPHFGDRNYCQQCERRLRGGESEICRPCDEHNEGTLMAHEALYGREEREMELERPERRQDGVDGCWHGDGWHWYDEDAAGDPDLGGEKDEVKP